MLLSQETIGENRKKWLEALRSGQYKQGTEFLMRGDRYCCLGVACCVLGIPIGRYRAALPDKVVNMLGLKCNLGSIDDCVSLADLNDSGKSFAELADIIESGVAYADVPAQPKLPGECQDSRPDAVGQATG